MEIQVHLVPLRPGQGSTLTGQARAWTTGTAELGTAG